MRRAVLDRTVHRLTALALGCAAVATLSVCLSRDPEAAPPSGAPSQAIAADAPRPLPTSAQARARIDAIRAAFPSALASLTVERFEILSDGRVRPIFRAPIKSATVDLPQGADRAVRLADDASKLAIQFTLIGARPKALEVADGIALYAGAGPDGADVLHRVGPTGTEDFVFFEQRPSREEVRYAVDTSAVAGLRLVAGTLEFLDPKGAPRLRVAPPFVIDRAGVRRAASLSVEGCAVDTDVRGPWGRPVTPPGASQCVVAIGFSLPPESYPALFDPQWMSTLDSMATARAGHTATLLNYPSASQGTSWVLFAGGFETLGGATSTAELYEPLSRTFASTGSMGSPRGAHTATLLMKQNAVDPKDYVLIAGGMTAWQNGSILSSMELYKPETGDFEPGPSLAGAYPRVSHTATLFDTSLGRVLIAGGTTNKDVPQATPTSSAEIFTWTDGTRTPISMVKEHSSHAAVRIEGSSKVLITGGFNASNFVVQDAELFDGGTGSFTLTQMTAPRAFHTATSLSDGQVLIAGGTNGSGANQFQLFTAEVYIPDQGFAQVGSMVAGRSRHTATLLPSKEVLIAGGFNGASAVSTTEIFSPMAGGFSSALPPLYQGSMGARHGHTATLVNAGDKDSAGRGVLVAGGSASPDPVQSIDALSSAKILVRPLGDPCVYDAECASGHCSDNDNVCCDEECVGQCRSCTAAGKGTGADGTCGDAQENTLIETDCIGSVQFSLRCDALGNALPKDVFDCNPSGCDPKTKQCATLCDNKDTKCSTKGWCVFDGGGGGAGGGGGEGGAGGQGGGGPLEIGYCKEKGVNGAPCSDGIQCLSGYCVDERCCNLPCQGQCQACDIENKEGLCSELGTPEKPEPPRHTPCDGAGTGCEGYCDGQNASACTYPKGTPCGQRSCSCEDGSCEVGPGLETSAACNGQAACIEVTSPCGGFRCDGVERCKTTCASDDDCVLDYTCEEDTAGGVKTCKALKGPKCDGDHTVKLPKADDKVCEKYKCRDTECLSACQTVDDCVPPHACNTKGECVIPPESFELSSSCSIAMDHGSGRAPPIGAALCGIAALAAAARLQRGRRRERSSPRDGRTPEA